MVRKRYWEVEKLSIIYSTIFHTIVLLFLALSFPTVVIQTYPISIDMSLNEVDATEDIHSITIEEYSFEEINNPVDLNYIPSIDIELISVNQNDLAELMDVSSASLESDVLLSSAKNSVVLSAGQESKNPASKKAKADTQEFNKRLSRHKGKKGEIQVSIIWDDINDIDLHVYVEDYNKIPISKIDWTSKIDRFGGMLDIDMNSVYSTKSSTPIENIFWRKNSPEGVYYVYVNHFKCYDFRKKKTPVKVMIKNKNETKVINIIAEFGKNPILVAEFEN